MPKSELKGKVSLDGSQWRAGLLQLDKQADEWGRSVTKTVQGHLLAAFSLTAALRTASSMVDRWRRSLSDAGSLVMQARKADLGSLYPGAGSEEKLARSIELIQGFNFALGRFGVDGDRASDLFQDISTRRVEALESVGRKKKDGSIDPNDQLRAFLALGVSEDELKSLSGPQLLFRLGELTKGISESDEVKEAMDALFSDAGVEMLVLMREGLKENIELARREGLIVGGEEILARDRARQRDQISEARTQIEIDRANKSAEKLSELERRAKLGAYSAAGSPNEVLMGTAAGVLDTIHSTPGFLRVPPVETLLGAIPKSNTFESDALTELLEARLEQRRLLREIADNTRPLTR